MSFDTTAIIALVWWLLRPETSGVQWLTQSFLSFVLLYMSQDWSIYDVSVRVITVTEIHSCWPYPKHWSPSKARRRMRILSRDILHSVLTPQVDFRRLSWLNVCSFSSSGRGISLLTSTSRKKPWTCCRWSEGHRTQRQDFRGHQAKCRSASRWHGCWNWTTRVHAQSWNRCPCHWRIWKRSLYFSSLYKRSQRSWCGYVKKIGWFAMSFCRFFWFDHGLFVRYSSASDGHVPQHSNSKRFELRRDGCQQFPRWQWPWDVW